MIRRTGDKLTYQGSVSLVESSRREAQEVHTNIGVTDAVETLRNALAARTDALLQAGAKDKSFKDADTEVRRIERTLLRTLLKVPGTREHYEIILSNLVNTPPKDKLEDFVVAKLQRIRTTASIIAAYVRSGYWVEFTNDEAATREGNIDFYVASGYPKEHVRIPVIVVTQAHQYPFIYSVSEVNKRKFGMVGLAKFKEMPVKMQKRYDSAVEYASHNATSKVVLPGERVLTTVMISSQPIIVGLPIDGCICCKEELGYKLPPPRSSDLSS